MSTGPRYHTYTSNPEKSVSEYLKIPYNADLEKYYENSVGDSGITLPNSLYIGPGNSLNLGEPKTEADRAAKIHDLTYTNEHYKYSKGETTENEYHENIRTSDFDLIKRVDILNPQSNWARTGLAVKQLVENITGQIYPGSKKDLQKYEIPSDDIEFNLLGKHAKA
jgi:hypothetical protein